MANATTVLNEQATIIATDRYFNDKEKQILEKNGINAAWSAMCARVGKAVAKAESSNKDKEYWQSVFTEHIENKKLVPGGRFWANAGLPNQQFPNCFVFGIEDSRESIYTTLKNTAHTHAGGGGCGFNFSKLRSRGMPTKKSRGIASGPVTFMKLYDASGDTIVQGGSRRAAMMGILNDTHPDILEFINLKNPSDSMRRFNISCALHESFMDDILDNDTDIGHKELIVTDPDTEKDYFVFLPKSSDKSRMNILTEDYLNRKLVEVNKFDTIVSDKFMQNYFLVTVQDVWDLIAYKAWECGDPGLIFIDEINKRNPLIWDYTDTYNRWYISATNPCSEIPQSDDEICMLSAINLAEFVDVNNSKIFWGMLQSTVEVGVRFLDNAIDVSTYPTPQNEEAAKTTRRIGLGVMGFADMLIKLKVPYGSTESVAIAKEVMSFINDVALNYSVKLGKEKGSFPLFEQSAYADGRNEFPKVEALRNSYRTTVAPTGTTSILLGVSSGIEPVFNFSYIRRDEIGQRQVIHPAAEEMYNKWKNDTGHRTMSFDDWYKLIRSESNYMLTAPEIPFEKHIAIQSAFQHYVDNAISKTINLPNSATVNDIKHAYELAYTSGCKGITVYRDGSKDVQVLSNNKKDNKPAQSNKEPEPEAEQLFSRNDILSGCTYKVNTGSGTMYITINSDNNGNPIELFATVGKAGSDVAAYTEAIGRLISILLQRRTGVDDIKKQLIGIAGANPVFHKINGYKKILSVPDAIGKILEFHIDKIKSGINKTNNTMSYEDIMNMFEKQAGSKPSNENDTYFPVTVGNSAEVCNTCGWEIQNTRGCRSCGCGSKCE